MSDVCRLGKDKETLGLITPPHKKRCEQRLKIYVQKEMWNRIETDAGENQSLVKSSSMIMANVGTDVEELECLSTHH